MTMDGELIDLEVEVTEMTDDLAHIVRLDPTRVQELLDDYPVPEGGKPQFPILRVKPGVSGNKNNWSPTVLRDVAEQINSGEKPGYWGHIRPEDRGYVFPDIETIWLGATVTKQQGEDVLFVKGFNVPGGRAYKNRRMAKVTSWAGKAAGPVVSGIRQIQKFTLESIDWARPGSQGMSAGVVAIATEMEGSDNVSDVNWATVTLEELEKNNPSLFTLMRQRVESEHSDSVSEMEEDAKVGKEATTVFQRLRDLLGIDDKADIVEAVVELHERVENIGRTELREKVAAVLTGKLKSPRAKSVVLNLLPVTEMEGKTDEEIETWVSEQFDKNEDVKAVVTEMEQAPAPLRQRSGDNGRTRAGGSGMVRETTTKL